MKTVNTEDNTTTSGNTNSGLKGLLNRSKTNVSTFLAKNNVDNVGIVLTICLWSVAFTAYSFAKVLYATFVG